MNFITTLFLINALRQTPLIESHDLDIRAQARAEQLCKDSQWSHDGYVDSFKGMKWRYAGENLSKGFIGGNGYPDPLNVVLAWYNSPTHKDNMLNPHYKYEGMGEYCGIIVNLFSDIDR